MVQKGAPPSQRNDIDVEALNAIHYDLALRMLAVNGNQPCFKAGSYLIGAPILHLRPQLVLFVFRLPAPG